MAASPVPTHRPRSRSFSSTPTFSSDLSKLRHASTNSNGIVTSYSEAIRIASTFDVLMSSHSPLASKVALKCEDDWMALLKRSGCVRPREGAAQDDDDAVTIEMERFLRYCFDVAYKMPASPNTACRPKSKVMAAGVHERSKSHGNIPLAQSASSAKIGIVLP